MRRYRVSSGLRINRGKDDAAGLAVRELIRVDIAARRQGSGNAADAVSMLQVAEGGLQVIDIEAEDLLADEWRISDVDVAMEMATLPSNRVLTQADISMLSQANMMPHMALQLLQ